MAEHDRDTLLTRRLSDKPAGMRHWVGRFRRHPRVGRPRETLTIHDKVVYAIGDVHGCHKELLRLEELIRKDAERYAAPKLIVMLGDYVDRGPNSARVLDHLSHPPDDGFGRLFLCGNHDDSMLRFIEDPARNKGWLSLGGEQTLLEYHVDIRHLKRGIRGPELSRIVKDAIPSEHVAFLRNLNAGADAGDVVFVHAGIRPGVAFDAQSDEDMLWIREPFLSDGPCLPLTVVHGHTPASEPQMGKGRIGVDTGCFRTGCLTAVRLLAGSVSFLSTRSLDHVER